MKLVDVNNAVLVWGPVSTQGLAALRREDALVVVPEQRPYLIGLVQTIPLLDKEGIKFFYCSDTVVGFLCSKKKIRKAYFFYQDKTAEGALWAISGSLYFSLLCKLHAIPLELLRQGEFISKTLDQNAATLAKRGFLVTGDKNECIIEPALELVTGEILR